MRLTDIDPVILDPAGAAPGLMVATEFSVAGESLVDEVPVLDRGDVGRDRCGHLRDGVAQVGQALLDGAHGVSSQPLGRFR